MDPILVPGHFTKAMVTTKKAIRNAPPQHTMLVIIEAFLHRREGQREIQVYTDLMDSSLKKPFHMSMHWAEVETYFENIEIIHPKGVPMNKS